MTPSPSSAAADNAALRLLLDSPGSITQIFPDQVGDIDIEEFHRKFEIVCRGYCNLRTYHNKTKVLLGRALHCIQQRPILYKEKGFRNFEMFLRDASEKFDISRSEMYNTLSLAKTIPDITLKECAEIGITKLYKVGKVLSAGPVDAPGRADIIEKAKAMTFKQFDQHLAEKAHLQSGDSAPAIIVIHTTATIKHAWDLFSGNPRVHAYCESNKPGAVLMSMMEECMAEWMAQAAQGKEEGDDAA